MKRFITCILFLVAMMATSSNASYAAIPIKKDNPSSDIQHEIIVRNSQQKNSVKQLAYRLLHKKADNQHRLAAIIMSILIPFVGVAIWQDRISKDFWITLLLTLMLYVPGLIYALSVILNSPNY